MEQVALDRLHTFIERRIRETDDLDRVRAEVREHFAVQLETLDDEELEEALGELFLLNYRRGGDLDDVSALTDAEIAGHGITRQTLETWALIEHTFRDMIPPRPRASTTSPAPRAPRRTGARPRAARTSRRRSTRGSRGSPTRLGDDPPRSSEARA